MAARLRIFVSIVYFALLFICILLLCFRVYFALVFICILLLCFRDLSWCQSVHTC
jgi:hypothetical protein